MHLLVVDAHVGGAARCRRSRTRSSCGFRARASRTAASTPAGADALVKFTHECLTVAEDQGVEDLLAFATSAIREAPNGEEVLARVLDETGVDAAGALRRGRVAADLPRRPPLVRVVQRPAAGARHRRRLPGARRRAGRGAGRRAGPAARRRPAHPGRAAPAGPARPGGGQGGAQAGPRRHRPGAARRQPGRRARPRRRHQQDAALAGPDRRRRTAPPRARTPPGPLALADVTDLVGRLAGDDGRSSAPRCPGCRRPGPPAAGRRRRRGGRDGPARRRPRWTSAPGRCARASSCAAWTWIMHR